MESTSQTAKPRLLILSPADNVGILSAPLSAGGVLKVQTKTLTLEESLGLGAKIALRPILKAEKVIKFGAPIGSATRDISPGEHVHIHNLASDYIPTRSGES